MLTHWQKKKKVDVWIIIQDNIFLPGAIRQLHNTLKKQTQWGQSLIKDMDNTSAVLTWNVCEIDSGVKM